MRRTLAIAVGLSAMLLVSTASAVNWVTWHCPIPQCDSVGKAYYFCTYCNAGFTRPAEVDADGQVISPQPERCPTCQRLLDAQWAACKHDNWEEAHKFYAINGWRCWWNGQWYDYNYYSK